MHMSDAMLSPKIGILFYIVSAGLLAWSARKVSAERKPEKVPLMGVLGAFIFAAQMINFSIPGTGSSGHIGGGMLLAVILGAPPAFLIMASVLTVQCLLFADGGLLALGANIFNLTFWPCFVGLPLFRILSGGHRNGSRFMAALIAAVVVSLELDALSVVGETVLSGITELPFSKFAAIMLGIHLPIALVEGALTCAFVAALARARPDLIFGQKTEILPPSTLHSYRKVLVVLFSLVILTGGIVAWFASSHPDGLEWSIQKITGKEKLTEEQQTIKSRLQAIQAKTAFLPDYDFKSGEATAVKPEPKTETENRWPAVSGGTSLAGVVGAGITAACVGVTALLLFLVRGRRAETGVNN